MSFELPQEEIPQFVRRIGDHVLQGSNNTLIVLGTDRAKRGAATIDDGLGSIRSDGGGKGAGAIIIVAGRKDKQGNPDLDKDSSVLYLSMKTDVDKNVGTDSVEKDSGRVAGAILRSDSTRILGRSDVKVAVDGGSYIFLGSDVTVCKSNKVIFDSPKIELGRNATQGVPLIDPLSFLLQQIVFAINNHVHPIPGNIPTPISITVNKQQLSSKRTFVDPG
jgi:hypothetical protein